MRGDRLVCGVAGLESLDCFAKCARNDSIWSLATKVFHFSFLVFHFQTKGLDKGVVAYGKGEGSSGCAW